MAVRVNSGVVAVNSPITNAGSPNNASLGLDYPALVTGLAGRDVSLNSLTAGTVIASGAQFPLVTSSSFATANLTMATANTFYTGSTLALGSGVYLITAQVTVASPNNTAQRVTAKLSDGVTTVVAAEESGVAQGTSQPGYVSLPMTGILTLSTAGTARLDVASTVANSVILATPADNGAGTPTSANRATGISAIRIG
jgi:hypothetical protein